MLKKKLAILIVVPALMLLSACAGLSPAATSANPVAQSGAPNMANQPIESKLALGLLKLEGTDKAVDAVQAKTLLPLWKAVKTLSASSTASADEITALYQQIQESLTADQVQAIKDLSLSPDDTQALMTQYGVQIPQGAAPAQSSTRAAGSSNPQGGGFPGGDFGGGPGGPGGAPPDGGGFPGGGAQGAQTTPQAGQRAQAGGPRGGGMNLLFVDPLIKLLETKAGS